MKPVELKSIIIPMHNRENLTFFANVSEALPPPPPPVSIS